MIDNPVLNERIPYLFIGFEFIVIKSYDETKP
jgi:hypothetical protein